MKQSTLDHHAAIDRHTARQNAEREAERQAVRRDARRHAVANVLLGEARRLMVTAHILRTAERREWLCSLSSPYPEPDQAPGICYPR